MTKTWIVIADSRRARIFEQQERHGPLKEVESFANVAASRMERDATRTDHLGRPVSKGERVTHHTAEPPVFRVNQENDQFARTITGFLSQARSEERYDQLYLVAAPAFLGLIRGNLHQEVQRMVEEELPDDVAAFDVPRVERYLESKFD